jgi:hypothetical protein
MKEIPISLAVEDALSETIAKEILAYTKRPFIIYNCYVRNGFGFIKKNIAGFNNAAKGTPFLVITDLDSAECPLKLIKNWLPHPKHHNLLFRVAVKEVESWILADRDSLAKFLGIQRILITTNPDTLSNPKEHLINVTRRSRNRKIRDAIAPKSGSTATQGPDYNGELINYVLHHWSLSRASKNSPSLKRTIDALMSFTPRWSK